MKYEYEHVIEALDRQKAHGVARVTVHLTAGDYAWNPANHFKPFVGPSVITYEEFGETEGQMNRDGIAAYVN